MLRARDIAMADEPVLQVVQTQIKQRLPPPAQWKPGQSGNPGGRPSCVALRAALRPHEKECIDTLVSLMREADEDSVRLRACQEILCRLYGKPDSFDPDQLTEEELLQIILRRKGAAAS